MAESKYLKKVQGNGASTTLSASVSAVATSAPLTADTSFAGEGMAIIDEGQATEEFAYGTAKVGSAITILADDRGLEGGSAQAHAGTATVKGIITAGMWNNLITGVTNVLVNTTGALDTTKVVDLTTAQTLTNKTLTSPKINENVALTATATQLNAVSTLTKATAAENVAGTDDAKFVTALANVPAFNNSLYRQAIINGNFDVWQRGTTMTSVNGVTILADRWKMYTSSVSETNTFSQQDGTGVAGSRYCAKWQRANGQTGTTGFQLGQSLETQNSILFRGQKVTLSFWAKAGANYSATSGYLSCYIRTGTGTDGEIIAGFTGSATVASQDNVLTTSWQKFTVTTSDVIAGTVNQIGVLFSGIPVGTAGADDSFYITQVQLCAGSVALPFMPKSYEEELRACQRYFLAFGGIAYTPLAMGQCISTTAVATLTEFPVEMRIHPGTGGFSQTGSFQVSQAAGGLVDVTLAANQVSNKSLLLDGTGASGLTAGHATRLFTKNSATAFLYVSAEL